MSDCRRTPVSRSSALNDSSLSAIASRIAPVIVSYVFRFAGM